MDIQQMRRLVRKWRDGLITNAERDQLLFALVRELVQNRSDIAGLRSIDDGE